ncbi:hypothetical protein VNO77_16435 [Canavalia gladiata]|uniref:Uncharacterized protein n=1 Tax=Canavalia gladiata TaxID=3824 RepID=A0AAN9M5I1_CANGL
MKPKQSQRAGIRRIRRRLSLESPRSKSVSIERAAGPMSSTVVRRALGSGQQGTQVDKEKKIIALFPCNIKSNGSVFPSHAFLKHV